MFGALSFAVFRTDDSHTALRELIIQHMKSVCEDQPRVRLLAAMRYQDKTGLQRHICPSLVKISVKDSIDATRMDLPYVWEVAPSWRLQPIGCKYQ